MSEGTPIGASATEHDSAAYLKSGYLGEIAGELFFRELASRYPDHRGDLEVLAEVEAQTRRELELVLERQPSDAEIRAARDRGQGLVARYAGTSWDDMLTSMQPYIDDAVERIRAAEQHAPEGLGAVYQRFTAHEVALAEFIALALAGKDPTGPARAYLAGR